MSGFERVGKMGRIGETGLKGDFADGQGTDPEEFGCSFQASFPDIMHGRIAENGFELPLEGRNAHVA